MPRRGLFFQWRVGYFRTMAAVGDTVLVEVRNVRDSRGHVLVSLCTAKSFLTMRCPYQGFMAAKAGTVLVRIASVQPGMYSAQAFHDYNDTRKLGKSVLGLPNKGLGFSRDARMFFGPPKFADAAFPVDQPVVRVTVTLRYYF